MPNSYYPSRAIKTIAELSEILGEEPEQLLKVAEETRYCYKPNPQPKPDGTERMTYIVLQPLQRIQKKIKNRILSRVHYAEYLFFGIKGKNGPKANAAFHCRNGAPKVLVTLDIKKFYPSVTPVHIKNIWLFFFKFSEPVAELLTVLTTFSNELPQGASTSVHLSNLVFCRYEARLVEDLKIYKAIYSRYADDLNITLNSAYFEEQLSRIIDIVISFLTRSGFKQNRDKFKINTQRSAMIINKTVCINNGYLSLARTKRKTARTMVDHYEKAYIRNIRNPSLLKEHQKVMGFLNHCNSIKSHKDIRGLMKKMKGLNPWMKDRVGKIYS